MKIPFAPWAPDSAVDNSGLSDATENAIPADNYYLAQKDLDNDGGGALSARCRGAITVYATHSSPGAKAVYAGDATKLYAGSTSGGLAGYTWGDISKSGGYSLSNDRDRWAMTSYNGVCYATNNKVPLQQWTAGGFTDAGITAAPKADVIAVVNDFVVVGNVNPGIQVGHRVQWCAIGDPTDWTVSSTTQADYQDLVMNNGRVTGIVGGDHGYIFQEHAITRMDYVGSPVVFQFSEVVSGIGAATERCMTQHAGVIYFISSSGFHAFTGGGLVNIGEGFVDHWFWDNVDRGLLYAITCAYDPVTSCVMWSIPTTYGGRTPTGANAILCFNVNAQRNKWSVLWTDSEILFGSNLQDSIESVYAFDSSHKAAGFIGDYLPARVETGEFSAEDGGMTYISRVRPTVTLGSGSATMALYIDHKDISDHSFTLSGPYSAESDGAFAMRIEDRKIRAALYILLGFGRASGIDVVEMSQGSKR